MKAAHIGVASLVPTWLFWALLTNAVMKASIDTSGKLRNVVDPPFRDMSTPTWYPGIPVGTELQKGQGQQSCVVPLIIPPLLPVQVVSLT